MGVWTRFAPSAQQFSPTCNNNSELRPSGSWVVFIAASIATLMLIFSAAAQNIAHGWSLGAVTSEFRAVVLAAASAGASILGPFCWLALVRGRGFGTRSAALLLALGCLAYAGVCSLGFVAGARDQANSERSISADAYQDRRAVATAARAELASLKGQSEAVLKRRRELTKLLTDSITAKGIAAPGRDDLRDLLGDRMESRKELRDLILSRLASRDDLRDLLRDRFAERKDLRHLVLDRLAARHDLRDLLRDRLDRRSDLRDMILDHIRNSDDSPALSRIRARLGEIE